MADTEQVDNEINLEQLKVLKEIFEVRFATLAELIELFATSSCTIRHMLQSFSMSAVQQWVSHHACHRPQTRMGQGSWTLMSSVPSWDHTWVSISSPSRWRSCS